MTQIIIRSKIGKRERRCSIAAPLTMAWRPPERKRAAHRESGAKKMPTSSIPRPHRHRFRFERPCPLSKQRSASKLKALVRRLLPIFVKRETEAIRLPIMSSSDTGWHKQCVIKDWYCPRNELLQSLRRLATDVTMTWRGHFKYSKTPGQGTRQ